MTNILTECANKIVDKLMNLTIAEAGYFCCFKCIVEDFEKEKGELKAKLTTVGKDVADARRRADDIRDEVTFWQEQAEKLIEEDTETKMTGFLGRCPNCIWRYRRGKELSQKIDEIKGLKGTNFESVGRAPNLPGVEDRPSQGYIHFGSRGSEYTELLDALADDNNYMTGLQGMGGTGKTTMATEVGKKLQKSKKFDHVIFTTVSNAPDVKKIQDEIAAPFSLELKEKSEAERHKILWKALTNGRKILIILDDVWEMINFCEIGIPTCDNRGGCKVLLTTRDARVCLLMGCHRNRIIRLGLISEQDSWILFKKHAGISDNSSKNMQDKGQKIAKECKRLPLAIAAIASTLKGQSLVEWDAALNALQDSMPMHDVDESLKEVYKCLSYSYNNMKSEAAKRLFLLCSVFPEDEEIPIDILTIFGTGLGLLEEVDQYDKARSQVIVAKNKLVDSCLLLETEEGYVKMHDLVREVALWIAKKEIHVVMLSNKKQKALVGTEKNIRYLYCYGKDVDMFSSWFDGTKLEILLVCIDSTQSVEVPDAFFERMSGLRVLCLSYENWPTVALSLPQSIQSLMNIRSLFLEHWKLGDISILGTLRSLETLDLNYCSISELPNKITELEKLRLLNLNVCKIERNNPFEVIERCLSLEELYFNANKVSSLDSINEAEAIDQNRTTFPTLQRYYLQKDVEMDDSISRYVCLRNIEAFVSEAAFKYLVRRAEILKLKGIKGAWRNLIPEIVPMEDEGMNDLVKLGLKSCSKVQCLIDNTKHIYSHVQNVFSKLVGLKLEKMDNLEELCSGPYPLDFLKSLESLSIDQCEHLRSILIKSKLNLCNLKIMELKGCPMLASLFQLSTARSLVLLEKLEICECEQLINIITDERSGDEKGEEIVDVDNDYKSCGSMFPKLKSLEIRRCHRLEFVLPVIFSGDVPLLETIKISDCGKLKYIFGRYQHEDQYLHQEVKDVVLGSLKEMLLSGSPNFIEIFPECYHPMSSSVKKSSSRDGSKAEQSDPNKRNIFPWSHICCYPQKYRPKLRNATSTNIQVVSKDGLPDCSTSLGLQTSNSDCLHPFKSAQCLSKQSQILRNIREIELYDLQEIKSIFILSIAPTMFLEILKINECHGLKQIIIDIGDDRVGNDRGTVFPKLKNLSIKYCDQLEYIVGQYPHDHHNYDEIHIHLPALENLSLENLPNVIRVCPKSHRVMWPSMKKFHLTGCPQLTVTSISDIMVDWDTRQLDLITTTKTLNSECLHPFESAQCLFKQSQILRNIREIKLKDLQMIKSLFILSIAPIMLLEDLIIEACHELKHIITDIRDDCDGNDWGTIFPKLKKLSVYSCRQLEYMFGQHPDVHQNYNEIHIHLPALEKLHLQNLPNVICVFPKCYQVTWPSMKELYLIGCPQFTVTSTSDIMDDLEVRQLDLITTTKGLQTSNSVCLHPFGSAQCLFKQSQIMRNIKKIELRDLQMIKSLFILSIAPTMLLEDLIIDKCHELKHILTDIGDDCDGNDWVTIFPKLKRLLVYNCDKLEYIFGQRPDDHQNYSEIYIHLPALEKLYLQNLPNVISVCPKSHRVTWPSMRLFHLIGCPQFRVTSTSDSTDDLDARQLDLITTTKDLRGIVKHFHALEILSVMNLNLESIFRPDELQVIGLQMSLGLKYLMLENLPQMTYIYVGPKNSLTLQNLKHLRIVGCGKLEVIFPASILRCLPQLAILEIEECKELKQIIEEDVENQKLSNLPSPQPCFPNLTTLLVRKCNKLKRLISVSASNELPKLQILVIDEASELEDVFVCEQGDAIGELKVELPKLEILIFTQLPSLCRGIALQTARYRFVHNCPKLSLTSSATLEEIKRSVRVVKDLKIDSALFKMLYRITNEDASNQSTAEETTPEIEAASSSELPSSQINTNLSMQAACNQNDNGIESGEFVSVETITKGTPDQEFSPIASLNLIESNEESEKEFVGKVPGSEIPDIATSPTNSELIRRPSPIPLDIPLRETHSHELVDEQSMSESCLMHQQQQLGQTQITIEIPQENYCLKEAEDQRIQESSRSEKTITAILSSDSETRNTSPIPLLPSLEKCIKRGVEEGSTSENAKIVTLSFHSEPPSSLSGQLVTSQRKTYPQSIKRGVEEGSTLENANQNDNGIQSDEFIFVETITKRTLDQEFSHNASPNLAESNEESEKEFVGKVPGSEIPDIVTSPTNSELIRGPSRSPLDIPLHETHTHELVDEQVIGESCLMIQQQPLRETQITIEIPEGNNCLKEAEDQSTQENTSPVPLLPFLEKIIKRGVEEGTASVNAKIVTSSTRSEPPSSLSGQLVTSQRITYPHSENMLSQTETFTNKEREGDPMSIQDFGDDDDLISLFQSMEEDGDDQIPTPSVSVVAMEHLTTKDNFVAKVLTDLEVSLKMPLKDIASSEANGLRLLTPLKFLSRLLLEDVTLSDGLKATIDSLHQEFPSILCSFKQAFATTNKFAMLEDKEKTIKEELAEKKKAAITIVSKISKAKKFMDEAQQKKAISKEQIIRLEKEIKDCEADLSSLQEEKKKCVAETRWYKKEFETVRKDKSQMVEDQRKAQHELYEIDYKWSSLCSQFELNRIATRNLS